LKTILAITAITLGVVTGCSVHTHPAPTVTVYPAPTVTHVHVHPTVTVSPGSSNGPTSGVSPTGHTAVVKASPTACKKSLFRKCK
jgi:PBP1b-binding outer membrane lipoprotein LpoB